MSLKKWLDSSWKALSVAAGFNIPWEYTEIMVSPETLVVWDQTPEIISHKAEGASFPKMLYGVKITLQTNGYGMGYSLPYLRTTKEFAENGIQKSDRVKAVRVWFHAPGHIDHRDQVTEAAELQADRLNVVVPDWSQTGKGVKYIDAMPVIVKSTQKTP